MSGSSGDQDDDSEVIASTPKKRMRDSLQGFGNLSNISEGDISGEESENGLVECDSKKLKVEGSEERECLEVIDHDNGKVESLLPGPADQTQVTPDDPGEGLELGQHAAQQAPDQDC